MKLSDLKKRLNDLRPEHEDRQVLLVASPSLHLMTQPAEDVMLWDNTDGTNYVIITSHRKMT